MDAVKEFEMLKSRVQSLREEKLRKEEQLNSLKEQEAVIEKELKEYGVGVDALADKINELERSVKDTLETLKESLPEDSNV